MFSIFYLTDPDPRGSMGLGGKEEVLVGRRGSFLTAIDPKTGKVAWRHEHPNLNGGGSGGGGGLLATAGGLVFGGTRRAASSPMTRRTARRCGTRASAAPPIRRRPGRSTAGSTFSSLSMTRCTPSSSTNSHDTNPLSRDRVVLDPDAGAGAGAVADSRDPPEDEVGRRRHSRHPARVSASADGAQAVDQPERHVELRDHRRRRAAPGVVRRPDPRALRGRIAVERRGRVGRAGPAALVSPDLRDAVDGRRRAPAAELRRGRLGSGRSTSTARRSAQHRGGYDPFTFDITDALRPARRAGARRRGPRSHRRRTAAARQAGAAAAQHLVHRGDRHLADGVAGDGARLARERPAGSIPIWIAGTVAVSVGTDRRAGAAGRGDRGASSTARREVGRGTGPTVDDSDSPRRTSGRPPIRSSTACGSRSTRGDEVESYFGMRSIAVRAGRRPACSGCSSTASRSSSSACSTRAGGPTASTPRRPTRRSRSTSRRRSDLGFNVIRKHVKVEPARWYYHADRLGMLVWQDMPSGDNKGADAKANFARELQAEIDNLRNHPSIVMWVPFNEGWGQHDTEKYRRVDQVLRSDAPGQQRQRLDRHERRRRRRPARLSRARRCRRSRPARAAVLGEFGGLGLPVEGHTWLDRGNWGYRTFTSLDEMNAAYRDLLAQLRLHEGDGLAVGDLHADHRRRDRGQRRHDLRPRRDQAVAGIGRRQPAHVRPAAAHHAPRPRVRSSPQTWRYTTTAPSATGSTRRSTTPRGRAVRADSAPPTRGSRRSAPNGRRRTSGCGGPSTCRPARSPRRTCASFTTTTRRCIVNGILVGEAAGRQLRVRVRAADRRGARGAASRPEHHRRPRSSDPRRPVHRRRPRRRPAALKARRPSPIFIIRKVVRPP